MSFHLPSDEGFDEARSIRRGVARLDPIFDRFVAEFAGAFGMAPLTLTTVTMRSTRTSGAPPRLGVVLERTVQYRAFFDADGLSYDHAKQSQVAGLFAKSVARTGLAKRFGFPFWRGRVDWAEDLFVSFGEFERTAKWAAHDAVTGPELETFAASLHLGDWFWCTQRFAGPPTVFVHTDEQAAHLREGDLQDDWADLSYPLVHRHDEFDYISRAARS